MAFCNAKAANITKNTSADLPTVPVQAQQPPEQHREHFVITTPLCISCCGAFSDTVSPSSGMQPRGTVLEYIVMNKDLPTMDATVKFRYNETIGNVYLVKSRF
jgi:hypothetical protein